MKVISTADVADWIGEHGLVQGFKRALEVLRMSRMQTETQVWSDVGEYDFIEGPARYLGTSALLSAAIAQLVEEDPDATDEDLRSIPFFSLCTGLLLPLSGLDRGRIERQFGLRWNHDPLSREQRTKLVLDLLGREVGLSLFDKICAVMGDPFGGRKAWLGRDSLIECVANVDLVGPEKLVDRLPHVGEMGVLATETTTRIKSDPPLTAAEVFLGLRHLKRLKLNARREVVRELFDRSGKLERYFICGLILRKTYLKYQFNQLALIGTLAEFFSVPPEQMATAAAIVDIFETVRILEAEGKEGLRKIHLKPLQPVAPMLSGGALPAPGQVAEQKTATEIANVKFPLWVEKKYDGMRMMLHKATDSMGQILAAAFTRNRQDWTEWVPGIKHAVSMLPCANCILDGELHGMVLDDDGPRPADIYEVYGSLRGEKAVPVNLRYTAFDIIYLNGQDLTGLPFSERRRLLQLVIGPLEHRTDNVLLRFDLAEGQLATTPAELNALHEYFRRQGYEGTMAKQPHAPYLLGGRTNFWLKRKRVQTLDLAVTGAFFAVESEAVRSFGSYLLSAMDEKTGNLVPVGTVAGLDRMQSEDLVRLIFHNGLITGRRIESDSSSGTRPGIELMPYIVVTVKFESVIPASEGAMILKGQPLEAPFTLRSPQIVHIRANEMEVPEIDTFADLGTIWRREKYG